MFESPRRHHSFQPGNRGRIGGELLRLERCVGPDWVRLQKERVAEARQRALRVARLPGLRIHDLRHSAASFMVNSGVDLFAVGKVLGHASYQSTQRYAHLANDTLLAAVEAGAAKQAGA